MQQEPELTAEQLARFRTALEREASAAQHMRRSLGGDVERINAARRDSATDDEHDPEGATLAFERSQAQALREESLRRLAQIAKAIARLNAGDYGRCISCRGPIAVARLEARPWSALCIGCATGAGRHR